MYRSRRTAVGCALRVLPVLLVLACSKAPPDLLTLDALLDQKHHELSAPIHVAWLS